MKNKIVAPDFNADFMYQQELANLKNTIQSRIVSKDKGTANRSSMNDLAEILFITSYPPRECGIATYSQDLIKALNNKFCNALSIKVCALETGKTNYLYPREVKYILN